MLFFVADNNDDVVNEVNDDVVVDNADYILSAKALVRVQFDFFEIFFCTQLHLHKYCKKYVDAAL